MQFEILGELRVLRAGKPVEVGGRMSKRLLAALLVNAPRAVDRDTIFERLWGDHPPATARTALQVHVSHLRRALETDRGGDAGRVLRTTGDGYALEIEPAHVDAGRFEELVRDAEGLATSDPERALGAVESARALWHDRPWGALGDEPWLRPDVARLEEQRRQADELWAEVQLALGRHAAIVDSLARAVELEPLRERRWEQLMVARYRCGRQAEALRAYQDARRTLTGELGIEPSPSLRALERAVLDQDPSLAAPSLSLPKRARHNLPAPLSMLVGRGDDVAATRKLLEASRLVTITGAAGCGKSRLAVAVAAGIVNRYDDGVWFVDLAAAASADVVATLIAADLGLRGSDEHGPQNSTALLRTFLRDRELLVVLDSCEHVVVEVAAIVGSLLASCPRLRVLATSRTVIGLVGEAIEALSPLDVPEVDAPPEEIVSSSAVQLFVQRAFDAGGSIEQTSDQLTTIGELCRFLDGVPLAIELAARWATTLAPEQILERLETRLSLVAADDSAVDRSQALGAAIDWSHALLADTERVALRRLSVFPAGFTLVGAEAVIAGDHAATDTVIGTIARLVGSSLVRTDHRSDPPRYRMLEAIRDYASERLRESGDEDETRARQFEYFLHLARNVRRDEFFGPPVSQTFEALDGEHDNVRSELDRLLASGNSEQAVVLAGAMGTYWFERGHWREGQQWLSQALEHAPLPSSLERARALIALAQTSASFAGIAARIEELDEAIDICRRHNAPRHLGVALLYLALARGWRHELAPMRAAFVEARQIGVTLESKWVDTTITLYENLVAGLERDIASARDGLVQSAAALLELGDEPHAARALMYAGNISYLLADLPAARQQLEQSARVALANRIHGTHAHGLLALAQVAMELDDADAPWLFLDCLTALELIGDGRCVAICQRSLGSLAQDAGRFEEARNWLQQSLEELAAYDQRALAVAIADLARIYQRDGDTRRAVRLVTAAQTLAGQSGMPLTESERARIDSAAAAVDAALPPNTRTSSAEDGPVDLDGILAVARQP